MNTEAPNDDQANDDPATSDPTSPRRELLPLPGLAAISLYLLVLAGVIVFGVVSGRHYPLIFLVFAAAFMASSAGLIMLFRWAWSLALAAVLLLVVYDLWIFSTQHVGPALVQGLLNLIFFLYLVRPEVRSKLR
jgi:hypothetical protein